MKRIMTLITLVAIMINMMALSVSANTLQVEVTGDILSTIIDVDIPSTASFTIDPNVPEGQAGRYIMPTLSIRNNTTAPVTVTMTGFDNKAGSTNQFTEVARGDKAWDNLGAADSLAYIYLGLIATDNQADFLNHTSLLSAASADLVQAAERELCNIKAGGTITLDMECQSGSAFPNAITSVYEMTFVVSLYEGLEEVVAAVPEVPTEEVLTRLIVSQAPEFSIQEFDRTYSLDVADPTTSTITVETSTETTPYTINGTQYYGSQTLTINNTPGTYGSYSFTMTYYLPYLNKTITLLYKFY